jgi:hypothetical protein
MFEVLVVNGGELQCSLDGRPFDSCRSPITYINLAPGSHTFRARARDWAGNVDPTPVARTWTILR